MGFGLDLSKCAVTGQTEGLIYVSPRTGRAVSAKGAGEWADRMLDLPPCLLGQGAAPDSEVLQALKTTGYFMRNKLAKVLAARPLPQVRARFVEVFAADI